MTKRYQIPRNKEKSTITGVVTKPRPSSRLPAVIYVSPIMRPSNLCSEHFSQTYNPTSSKRRKSHLWTLMARPWVSCYKIALKIQSTYWPPKALWKDMYESVLPQMLSPWLPQANLLIEMLMETRKTLTASLNSAYKRELNIFANNYVQKRRSHYTNAKKILAWRTATSSGLWWRPTREDWSPLWKNCQEHNYTRCIKWLESRTKETVSSRSDFLAIIQWALWGFFISLIWRLLIQENASEEWEQRKEVSPTKRVESGSMEVLRSIKDPSPSCETAMEESVIRSFSENPPQILNLCTSSPPTTPIYLQKEEQVPNWLSATGDYYNPYVLGSVLIIILGLGLMYYWYNSSGLPDLPTPPSDPPRSSTPHFFDSPSAETVETMSDAEERLFELGMTERLEALRPEGFCSYDSHPMIIVTECPERLPFNYEAWWTVCYEISMITQYQSPECVSKWLSTRLPDIDATRM